MRPINSFKAAYCSGLLVPNQATMTALCLVFEKVYLPNDTELIVDFCRTHEINSSNDAYKKIKIKQTSNDVAVDPFAELAPQQKETALRYLDWCMSVAIKNHELFGAVIETDAFEESGPLHVELIREGGPGELNKYRVSRSPMILASEKDTGISSLIDNGYIPVIGSSTNSINSFNAAKITSKELASLLAIKSVEILFPATVAAPAEVILEAREKLHDQLSLFWSTMLKLSVEMKKAIKDCKSMEDVAQIGADIVDTTVRPALTDLNHKIELERKQWFFRVFGRVFRGLKVAAVNPPLSPTQLVKSSLILAGDVAMDLGEHLGKVDALKNEAGLTYLMDLRALIEKTSEQDFQ